MAGSTGSTGPALAVRRAADRYRTTTAWLETWHSLSAGRHYDAGNTSFGPLLLHDEHLVQPGSGFAAHRHRDVEIVTWVLEGALTHRDATGTLVLLTPGRVHRTTAGSGIVHSEDADGPEPVRFVQAWLAPDGAGGTPAHGCHEVGAALRGGGLVPVVPAGRRAQLHVARLAPGQSVELPDAPLLHVFVSRGDMVLEAAGPLAVGDAVRVTGGGGQRVSAAAAAEVMVWAMPAGPYG